MEAKDKQQDDVNANENERLKSQESDRQDAKDDKKEDGNKKITDNVDFREFVKTKNDKDWADKH